MTKIGVTGTRSGMNETQFAAMQEYLSQFVPADTELHHGDCVGVDVEVAMLAQSLGMRVVCHPPEKDELRANHNSDEIRKPLGHFARNRNIVDETDQLMVVPYQGKDEFLKSTKGGTLYTYNYAKKKGKEPVVFFPKRC